jgi:hypothetical protein
MYTVTRAFFCALINHAIFHLETYFFLGERNYENRNNPTPQ